jgi:hypothetical protein
VCQLKTGYVEYKGDDASQESSKITSWYRYRCHWPIYPRLFAFGEIYPAFLPFQSDPYHSMWSLDSTTSHFGPISEEPDSYFDSMPTRPQNALHRPRMTTSLSFSDLANSSVYSRGVLSQSSLEQYRMASYPPAHGRIKRFSSLSTAPSLAGDTAMPVPDYVGGDDGSAKLEPFDPHFKPVAVTPSHIMNKRYQRTYYQYVLAAIVITNASNCFVEPRRPPR